MDVGRYGQPERLTGCEEKLKSKTERKKLKERVKPDLKRSHETEKESKEIGKYCENSMSAGA
jgi:hypothetical protein